MFTRQIPWFRLPSIMNLFEKSYVFSLQDECNASCFKNVVRAKVSQSQIYQKFVGILLLAIDKFYLLLRFRFGEAGFIIL